MLHLYMRAYVYICKHKHKDMQYFTLLFTNLQIEIHEHLL
jgi:hypothetical protein